VATPVFDHTDPTALSLSSLTSRMTPHAFLAGEVPLTPGDLVCFGISHPCTAFDKWQVIPVIDDDCTVVDLIRTYF
jgi:D-serine deaminase-like pyridoxal phosphate-dependent protein